MQISAHSPRTFASPRKRNCLKHAALFELPNAGSTMHFRVACSCLPRPLSCELPFLVSRPRLAPIGNGPGLHALFRCACLCLSVATNRSILRLCRYFRISSEQYALASMTPCGFCPDCCSIVSTSGTSCWLSFAACVTRCPTMNCKAGSPGDVRVRYPALIEIPGGNAPPEVSDQV